MVLLLATLIDRLVGDPDWLWRRWPHPVVWFGVFNIVGRGTLPFSELVSAAGARAVPLPGRFARDRRDTARRARGRRGLSAFG